MIPLAVLIPRRHWQLALLPPIALGACSPRQMVIGRLADGLAAQGQAVEAMKRRGLTVTRPDAEQTKVWCRLADALYPRIRGKMVPVDTFDEVVALLKAYRATKAK